VEKCPLLLCFVYCVLFYFVFVLLVCCVLLLYYCDRAKTQFQLSK
jgi:hypothetical protein